MSHDELRTLAAKSWLYKFVQYPFDPEDGCSSSGLVQVSAEVAALLADLDLRQSQIDRASALHIRHRDSGECGVCRVAWPCETALALKPSQPKVSCARHAPVQHRDGKPPWCPACGLTADGQEPVSPFSKKEPK